MLGSELSQFPCAEEDVGDLGWLTPGSTSQTVSDFVFDSETELGIISEPISDETTSTSGGYWLFKIMGSGIKKISDVDRLSLVSTTINDWLESLMNDTGTNVIIYLDNDIQTFAVGKDQ